MELPIVVERPVQTTPLLDRVLARLEVAAAGDAVGEQLVQPVLDGTAVGVLFRVKDRSCIGSHADGTSVRGEALRKVVLPLDPPSMFQRAFRQRSLLVASAEGDWLIQGVADRLGLPAAGEVALAPVMLDGVVVALACYLTARGTVFPDHALDLLKLLSECATAAYRRLLDAGERWRVSDPVGG